jgi:hypothetical protein
VQEGVDAPEHLVELLHHVLEIHLELASGDARGVALLSDADQAEHLERPQQPTGVEVGEVRHLADLLHGGVAVHVPEQLLFFFRQLELVEHLGVSGGNGDDVDAAQAPCDLAPAARAPQALDHDVLQADVDRDESLRVDLLHDQLVVAAGPGHEIDQQVFHLLLDGGRQLLRLDRLQLDQDRA